MLSLHLQSALVKNPVFVPGFFMGFFRYILNSASVFFS